MKNLILATRNLHKAEELKKLIEDLPYRIRTLQDFPNCPTAPEDRPTFKENAIQKATLVARHTGEWTLADDSGLEVDLLHGKPGVHSARYAGPDASDAENNQKLLEALKDSPLDQRTARFRCALALADRSGSVEVVEGVCEGWIAFEPRGRHGFGYDPLFWVAEYGKTFGELGERVKSQISHRAIAMKKLKKILRNLSLRATEGNEAIS